MESCVRNPHQTRHHFDVEVLHESFPVVSKAHAVVFPDEADYLIQKANEHGFQQSTVLQGSKRTLSNERTSSSAFLGKGEDEVVTCIEKRLSALARMPWENLESLQVTRYTEGQKYNPHYDWFEKTKPGSGQRNTTVFAYLKGLDDEACGGATTFPNLSNSKGNTLRSYPTTGDAVMWSNVTFDGKGNSQSLHGGESVNCPNAEKIGLNAWFRDTKYEP